MNPFPTAPLMTDKRPPLTRTMARFAANADGFPPLARSRAADAMLDCIGCMLAGSREQLAGILRRVLAVQAQAGPQAPAALVGSAAYASAPDAALFNGAIAHALDYDDTNHPAYAHPSAVIVPALLAAAALAPVTGADLVTAYIAGFEVFGKLGRAMNTRHYKRGWHPTATFGTLAATVAAGRLLRLSEAQMVMALGIAASSAGGLRVNFGSMVKPLHAGQAARNGVLAVMLAREGFVASAESLEHDYGYLEVFNAGIGFDPAHLMALGERLEILTEHGLALKPYPSCGATHPGIEAALQLHQALGGAAIESVRAGVCEMAFAPLIYVKPESALQGKFSLHFCIAAALLEGKVGIATFTAEKIADRAIADLIPRITMEVDDELRGDGEFATRVTVNTRDGKRHERLVPLAMGKPARWFSADIMRAKFDDCARVVLDASARDLAYSRWRAMDSTQPVEPLLRTLHAVAGVAA